MNIIFKFVIELFWVKGMKSNECGFNISNWLHARK